MPGDRDGELAPAGRPEQGDEHGTGHEETDEHQESAVQGVRGHGPRRVLDRRLRSREELHVALQVLAEHPDGARRVDRGHRGGDLLDGDVRAERERQRGRDLHRAERSQVEGHEVVGGHRVPRDVRAEALLGGRRRDPEHE
ncbi:hypothetical protein [Cellulomonas sp. ATA003]|uniref:hypothetical protein n=1 Tax=Cellulomonas sp. ATA003 TaxID=3073064 RepID=UPI002872B023|nr:hypothetical protein [Cellulomonas sp. ATA003]WNB84622.1 hypothetical protein REH70_12480 [Cellulomonas sp. ATA003]